MLITLDPSEQFHELVAERLTDAGIGDTVAAAVTTEELGRLLADAPVSTAVLLGPGVATDAAVSIANALQAEHPRAVVLRVATPTTAELRSALRAGIRDVLPPNFAAQELQEALEAAGYGRGDDVEELPGLTIAVFSSKGGVGTSVLAGNLALRLAERTGAPAALADLDLASADQAVMLGLRPRFTIQDLADEAIGHDADAFGQLLVEIEGTDVRLLPGPVDPAAAETIGEGVVAEAMHRLRQLAGLVVVDTASAFTDTTLRVLETADVVVLPVSLDVLSLRALTVTLQVFERLGIDRDRVRVVAIRADAKVGLTLDDVARTTGMAVDVAVPSSRDVPRSVNTARPLALDAPRNAVVRAVDELAELLLDGVEVHGAVEDDDGGGLFGLLRRSGRGEHEPAAVPAEPSASDGPTTSDAPEVAEDRGDRAVDPGEDGADEVATDDPQVAAAPDRAPSGSPPKPVRVVRGRRRVNGSGAHPPTAATADRSAETATTDDEGAGDQAEVIELPDGSGRLTSMPPPRFDPTPADRAGNDDSRRARRRRESRS